MPKLQNSNLRITSTNKGQTVSSSVRNPGANYQTTTGSTASDRDISRTTTRLTGLGSQSGSTRETQSHQSPSRFRGFTGVSKPKFGNNKGRVLSRNRNSNASAVRNNIKIYGKIGKGLKSFSSFIASTFKKD